MITWNSLPDVFKVKTSFNFDVQEKGAKFLSRNVL